MDRRSFLKRMAATTAGAVGAITTKKGLAEPEKPEFKEAKKPLDDNPCTPTMASTTDFPTDADFYQVVTYQHLDTGIIVKKTYKFRPNDRTFRITEG